MRRRERERAKSDSFAANLSQKLFRHLLPSDPHIRERTCRSIAVSFYKCNLLPSIPLNGCRVRLDLDSGKFVQLAAMGHVAAQLNLIFSFQSKGDRIEAFDSPRTVEFGFSL